MKTLFNLLKQAFGFHLFAIAIIWMLSIGTQTYMLFQSDLDPILVQNVSNVLLLFLLIWTIGCCFSNVFNSTAENKMSFFVFIKSAFLTGLRLFCRFIFIFLPLLFTMLFTSYVLKTDFYLKQISLFYIAFVVAPYLLFLAANYENMPWISGFKSFLKKNISESLSFVFWSSFSFVLFTYFVALLSRITEYQTSRSVLLFFALMETVLLFFTTSFCCVLLKFLAQKTLDKTEPETKAEEEKDNK